MLVVPPVRAHAEADGAKDDAEEAISERLARHRLVHAVVHDEAALLEEERDEHRAQHVHAETVETEHGGESRPEYTEGHQRLDRVEPVIRLEEATLGEVLPELLEVNVGRVLVHLVSTDRLDALQKGHVVAERMKDGRRVLPDVLLDDRAARVDLLELRHVVPHSVDADRVARHVPGVDGTNHH